MNMQNICSIKPPHTVLHIKSLKSHKKETCRRQGVFLRNFVMEKGEKPMYRIFIVEDDPGISGAIEKQTNAWGMDARCAENFHEVMAEFAAYEPHLVLMDISLPFFNGYFWCQKIREVSKVPVIFISSASDCYGSAGRGR